MADIFEIGDNYNDLSTERGFQFEFNCSRCGSKHRTDFQASAIGTVTGVLDSARNVLGGLLGGAADIGEDIRSAGYEKARDKALKIAWNEVKGDFVQCPNCTSWVCRKSCWNTKRGICKECAPDLGVEMSVAQSERSVQEIHAHAAMAAEDKKLAAENWRETIRASCPECEAPLMANAKFCPECGAKLKSQAHCTQCGATLTPGAKFCPECGEKTGAN